VYDGKYFFTKNVFSTGAQSLEGKCLRLWAVFSFFSEALDPAVKT
jgi:hypothetical protein